MRAQSPPHTTGKENQTHENVTSDWFPPRSSKHGVGSRVTLNLVRDEYRDLTNNFSVSFKLDKCWGNRKYVILLGETSETGKHLVESKKKS